MFSEICIIKCFALSGLTLSVRCIYIYIYIHLYTQGTLLNVSHSSSEMALCVTAPTEKSSTEVISSAGNIKAGN